MFFFCSIHHYLYFNKGWPSTALSYVKAQGIANGSRYLYEGVTGTCKRPKFRPIKIKIDNVCDYNLAGDEKKLKALIDRGPVISCICNFLF